MISFEYVNGTPIFTAPDSDPTLGRVYGATADKVNSRWFFPAYAPLGCLVIDDLDRLSQKFDTNAQAQREYLKAVPELIANRTLPPGYSFTTKPFDHQLDGLVTAYHHPRTGLLWDPGCGKTKVMVDLFGVVKQRALVFAPRVMVQPWVREVAVHSGNQLKAITISGTPTQKAKIIAKADNYDVLVATYGTARNYAVPKLSNKVEKTIKAAMGSRITIAAGKAVAKTLRPLADADEACALFDQWLAEKWTYAEFQRRVDRQVSAKGLQWLKDIDYKIIVVDESHNIKEISSAQTKAILALSVKAPRRYILTGTPALGDPRHLYPQLRFLAPSLMPEDWMNFSLKFLVKAPWNKKIVTGFKNMNIINTRVQRVALRKRKDECFDLPPRSIIDVTYDLVGEQKKLYNTLVEEMSADLSSLFHAPDFLSIQNAATLLNKLSQVASGFVLNQGAKEGICNGCVHLERCVPENIQPYTPLCKINTKPPENTPRLLKDNPKLDALSDLLDTITADPDNKVIVWGIYNEELNMIGRLLEQKKLGYVRLDGKTSGKTQERIDRFTNDKDCRVWLGQEATGVGITLNAASYMIYFSYDWSLGNYLQSIDRNYRVGQTKKTVVYRLIGTGTVDEYKIKALDAKRDISSVLTNKLACTTCKHQTACLENNVELFDKGCIYQRSARRAIAKAEVILCD